MGKEVGHLGVREGWGSSVTGEDSGRCEEGGTVTTLPYRLGAPDPSSPTSLFCSQPGLALAMQMGRSPAPLEPGSPRRAWEQPDRARVQWVSRLKSPKVPAHTGAQLVSLWPVGWDILMTIHPQLPSQDLKGRLWSAGCCYWDSRGGAGPRAHAGATMHRAESA